MAVRELVLDRVVGALLPAALLIFDVAHALLIEIGLADVVQKAADRIALLLMFPLWREMLAQRFIDAHAVLDKAAAARTVVARTGRRLKKVGAPEPFQKLLRARTMNLFVINRQKLFLEIHCCPPLLHAWRPGLRRAAGPYLSILPWARGRVNL